MTRTPTLPALDEVSEVLRSVGNAPRLTLVPGWRLDIQPECWRIIANRVEDARTASHETLVGAGIAAEHLVIALEARHHRVHVQLLPADDPQAAATVRVVGRLHPTDLMLRLRDLSQHQVTAPELARPVTRSDLRLLNLTAESFTAEVMWSHVLEVSPQLKGMQRIHATQDPPPFATVVTHGDSPTDWVEAGRAVARLFLRAADLGLGAHPELQVLGDAQTRAELRSLWRIDTYPQAQFSLGTPVS